MNLVVGGGLIERVSGVSLESYCAQNVFAPLGMSHTRFRPPAEWLPQIAPTEYDERRQMLHGMVHDPTSRRMGGVAGNAGVVSASAELPKVTEACLDAGS